MRAPWLVEMPIGSCTWISLGPSRSVDPNPYELLEILRGGAIAKAFGKLVTQNRIKWNSYLALDYTAEAQITENQQARIYGRLIRVGHRVFQLSAMGPIGETPYSKAQQLFDTFRLTAVAASAPPSALANDTSPNNATPNIDPATSKLLAAMEEQQFGDARKAVLAGASVDYRIVGRPLIFNFIRNNKLTEVRFLLEQGAIVRSTTDQGGRTPLHEAALYGYVDIARLLIERGADVNAKNVRGEPPLFYAEGGLIAGPQPTASHAEVAKLLRDHGAREYKEAGSPRK